MSNVRIFIGEFTAHKNLAANSAIECSLDLI